MTLLAPHPTDLPVPGRLFGACSARDINLLRRRATEVTVAAGTVIHPADQGPKWVYIVMTGSAVSDDLGSSLILTAGDVHGARSVLAGDDTCGALVALTEVTLLVLGRREFTSLLAQSAGIAHGVARLLAERGPERSGRFSC